ncbi:hypothetical protein O181_099366 [Austropuccinia psidii MF-1]|uniref:Uncharacterized protein n=1 Tax=Austropuccinia psidii MF-1 TaxID=1389203 RepID=A0A9Q3JDA6_9BASI|nr:hypothetical protein [Austropuccinia psidii MF-1]
MKSHPEGLQQCNASKRVPDPCGSVENCMKSYLTVKIALRHPNTCKLLNGWHPLMENKNMMLLTAEWWKHNPKQPKQVPKTAPEDRRINSNFKKQPQAQTKGNGKVPATNPHR